MFKGCEGMAEDTGASSVFDSLIYGDMFGTEAMRAIFSDRRLVAFWLEAEVALASAERALGIIPAEAAQAIAAAARPEVIDFGALRLGMRTVGRPIAPLLDQICAAGGPLVEDWLHWGATTQDIMDTGFVLQIRAGLRVLRPALLSLLRQLATLAEQHRATPMVARTNGQDAGPISFGLMLASYASELHRGLLRLDEAGRGALVVQFGGAVGTLAAAGPDGLQIRAEFARRLDLREPDAPWNASRDTLAALVQALALLHAVLGRAAGDINLLSRTGEVEEGAPGASSTLPNKRNPRGSEFICGIMRMARIRAAGAMEMTDQSEVRQGAPWISEWSTLPEMFLLTAASLARSAEMFAGLHVNRETMRGCFDERRGEVMAEAAMILLARQTGRRRAYALVQQALRNAPAASLADALTADPAAGSLLAELDLAVALDPNAWLGAAPALASATSRAIFEALAASTVPTA